MVERGKNGENRSKSCMETANHFVRAIYESDGDQLLKLLSEGSMLHLQDKKLSAGTESLSSLAGAIRRAWNCPPERVLILEADFDHPHLRGRVRVPIILDSRESIPEGYILTEGAPLPSSCVALSVLLLEENGVWKVDNLAELAP